MKMNRLVVTTCLLLSTLLLVAHAQDLGVPPTADVSYNLDIIREGAPGPAVTFDQVGPAYSHPVFPDGGDPSLNEVGGEAVEPQGIPQEPSQEFPPEQNAPVEPQEIPQEPSQEFPPEQNAPVEPEEIPQEPSPEIPPDQNAPVPVEPEEIPQEPSQEIPPDQNAPVEPEEIPQEPSPEIPPDQTVSDEQPEDQPQEGVPNASDEETFQENEPAAGEQEPEPEESVPSDNEETPEEEAPQEGAQEEGAGEEPPEEGTPEEAAEEGTGSEPEAEVPEEPQEGNGDEDEATAEPEEQPEDTEHRGIVPEFAGTEGSPVLPPECPPDSESCVGPLGDVCGDHGSCVCGACVCESSYTGKYCQTCPTCPLPCQETSACVRCMVFNDGPLAGQRCRQECRFGVLTVDDVGSSENTCSVLDSSDCKITYALDDFFDSNVVRVKQTKDCPRVEGRRPNLLRRFLYGARNVGKKVWSLVKTGFGAGPSVEVNYNAAGRE